MIDRSTTKFDDILLHNKVLSRFSYYVPSFIVSKFVPYSLPSYPKAILSVQKMVDVYVIFVTMLVVSSLIGSFYDYYLSKDSSRNKPITPCPSAEVGGLYHWFTDDSGHAFG